MSAHATVATRDGERQRRFERLYDETHAPVLGYVLRRVDSPDAAADVFSETFLVAWRRLEQVPEGDRSRLWLYAVARRMLANQRRGEQRRTQLADRLRVELAGTLAGGPSTAEHSDAAIALSSLPESDRELLTLSGWEGLDPGEIATVLGCSRNAARIRLHRARRRLRAALDTAVTEPAPTQDHAVTGGGTP
jgi:RNA polymerase sigma factor (sigma-70 family)